MSNINRLVDGDYTGTATALSTIATSHLPALTNSLSQALESFRTETKTSNINSLSSVIRGAEASISIIQAEQVLATATEVPTRETAINAIIEATSNLKTLVNERDFYGYELNIGWNGCFLAIFVLLLGFFTIMSFRSRYLWFNVCFVGGFGVEVLSYSARLMATTNHGNPGYFALQNLRLVVAPTFIFAGVCFVFAQNITVYGCKYSKMRPMWYPYFFLGIFEFCLVIQAVSGGLSAAQGRMGDVGTIMMFIGMLIETTLMFAFLFFCLQIPYNTYFQDRHFIASNHELRNKSLSAFVKFFINTKSAELYKREYLERFFNPRYQGIRLRKLTYFYPLVIFISVFFFCVRCVFRSIETKQGFRGHLANHECYIFVFDSLPMALVGVLFTVFHPAFVFGKENVLRVVDLNNDRDSLVGEGAKAANDREIEEHDLSSIYTWEQRGRKPQNREPTLYIM